MVSEALDSLGSFEAAQKHLRVYTETFFRNFSESQLDEALSKIDHDASM